MLRLGCLWLIGLLLPLAVWAADDFLPPEQAFKVSARLLAADRAEVLVRIAPGYYVYRDPFRLQPMGQRWAWPRYRPAR